MSSISSLRELLFTYVRSLDFLIINLQIMKSVYLNIQSYILAEPLVYSVHKWDYLPPHHKVH